MPAPTTPFLKAITDLAKEFDVIAFAVSAVLPTDEGFGIVSGAASRMDDKNPETERVVATMEDSVIKAIKMVGGRTVRPF